jgi:hypothetical protein
MVSHIPIGQRPSFKHNIWLRIYLDRYEDLFSYAMKLVYNDEDLADEMVREISIATFANQKRLEEELLKLPEFYADIVRMYYFKKMSFKQIAKHLPLTMYQVEGRLHKAMRLLTLAINPTCFKNLSEKAERRARARLGNQY